MHCNGYMYCNDNCAKLHQIYSPRNDFKGLKVTPSWLDRLDVIYRNCIGTQGSDCYVHVCDYWFIRLMESLLLSVGIFRMSWIQIGWVLCQLCLWGFTLLLCKRIQKLNTMARIMALIIIIIIYSFNISQSDESCDLDTFSVFTKWRIRMFAK